MSDVKCPYCGAKQEIDHDGGYGYEEGLDFEQCCANCGKEFKYTTSISYSYQVSCQDGDHDMQQSPYRNCSKLWSCEKCDFHELRGE